MVLGVTYHGSTEEPLGGLDNSYGKHISAAKLEEHLSWISRRFKVLTIREILEHARRGTLPPNCLFTAFHDGYKGNYDVAFPLLKRFGWRVDFFITTTFIGTGKRFWVDLLDAALKYTERPSITLDHVDAGETIPLDDEVSRERASVLLRKRLKALDRNRFDQEFDRTIADLGWTDRQSVPRLGPHEACLTWDQVREMADAGMEFGSHTHNHLICATQEASAVAGEMTASKKLIQQEIGRSCTQFCYPNGGYPSAGNEVTDKIARDAGYESALYMVGGYNLVHADTFRLTGLALGEHTKLDELERVLSHRRFRWKRLRRSRIWPWEKDTL